MTSGENVSLPEALLSIPQHTRVSEPQYIISLFRQFLREQENIHRSVALELILLLILQQVSAAAGEQPADSPGNALAWRAQQNHSYPVSFAPFRIHAGAGAALQRRLSGGGFIAMFSG
ncbi:regulatory protein [Klebsiella michiganensis]|uniref:Regulatory protein n=1 Tax=Klebsiella michiganensis TaxID=1134687 RepID=A0A7H4PFK0_9ENTR|nr:regulatory protein [Klebsiella michiganensis]